MKIGLHFWKKPFHPVIKIPFQFSRESGKGRERRELKGKPIVGCRKILAPQESSLNCLINPVSTGLCWPRVFEGRGSPSYVRLQANSWFRLVNCHSWPKSHDSITVTSSGATAERRNPILFSLPAKLAARFRDTVLSVMDYWLGSERFESKRKWSYVKAKPKQRSMVWTFLVTSLRLSSSPGSMLLDRERF